MPKQHAILLVVAILIVVAGVFLFTSDGTAPSPYTETRVITAAETIAGDFTILPGEQTTLADNAPLTVDGDLTIDGALGCRDGSLTVHVMGHAIINNAVMCGGEDDEPGDVVIIAEGGLTMSAEAEITTSGNVQIVDGTDAMYSSEEMDALYDEVLEIPENGQAIGPFVSDDTELPESVAVLEPRFELPGFVRLVTPVAHAQATSTPTGGDTSDPVVVSGKIRIQEPPRPGVKRLVVINFPNTPEITIRDFELAGPDGRPGAADTGGNCNAKGDDGEDAFRFNAFAPSLKVNNFTLNLGNGGEGGEAITGTDCDPGIAKGGKGGDSGNFRMVGSQNFEIVGSFFVQPGNGGAGGGATAHGKNGGPTEKGGDATATGGKGADNKKKLSVTGTVSGTGNVQFSDIVGGVGGSAEANGGKGGDGDACGVAGGPGGNATANGGDGGDASLTVSGGAGRAQFATDIGGSGGHANSYPGAGGTGGACDHTGPGGDGGKGGDASSNEGKGGQGAQGPASDGVVFDEEGGDGGDGGPGCEPGGGGKGGSGDPQGKDGEEGENLCLTITKEEDFISIPQIDVIKHMDYYIPIAGGNLEKFTDESGRECDGAEHWHPGPGGAVNTMGYLTPDPDPDNCGFGKVSEVPILQIDDPAFSEQSNNTGAQQGNGEWVQVEPPKLIIPAR